MLDRIEKALSLSVYALLYVGRCFWAKFGAFTKEAVRLQPVGDDLPPHGAGRPLVGLGGTLKRILFLGLESYAERRFFGHCCGIAHAALSHKQTRLSNFVVDCITK